MLALISKNYKYLKFYICLDKKKLFCFNFIKNDNIKY